MQNLCCYCMNLEIGPTIRNIVKCKLEIWFGFEPLFGFSISTGLLLWCRGGSLGDKPIYTWHDFCICECSYTCIYAWIYKYFIWIWVFFLIAMFHLPYSISCFCGTWIWHYELKDKLSILWYFIVMILRCSTQLILAPHVGGSSKFFLSII